MKNNTLSKSFNVIAFFIIAVIFVLAFSISYSSLFLTYPELATGVTFDLTLIAPLLYLFIIWNTKIPKTTAIPFFVLNTILASYLIPVDQQFYLSQIKTFAIPAVEIGVLGILAYNVYKTVRAYRQAKDENSDILQILSATSLKLFGIPAFAKILAFELAVVYYAVFSWRKAKLTENTFTYHKKSGKGVFYGAIIFIIAIETVVLHILLANWNVYVAWVLTISSAYVVIQLFAHLKAVYQRPIEIIGDKLFVRFGLFEGAVIELDNIENVESTTIKPTEMNGVKQVSLLADLEQFNLKIKLKEESVFYGFYGREEKYETLLLYVDETEKFIKKLNVSG